MTHKGTVTLETERLILRRFTMADLEQIFYNCWSDAEVWKWTRYNPMHCVEDVINVAEMFTDKWLNAYDRPNRYSWAIQLKTSNEVIGRFFGMNPDDQISQINSSHALENPASGKVMQKCGMTYEGTLRQNLRCNNGLFDSVHYAINLSAKKDWLSRKE